MLKSYYEKFIFYRNIGMPLLWWAGPKISILFSFAQADREMIKKISSLLRLIKVNLFQAC